MDLVLQHGAHVPRLLDGPVVGLTPLAAAMSRHGLRIAKQEV